MARREIPRNGSESPVTLWDGLILGGLVTGFIIYLTLSARGIPESPAEPQPLASAESPTPVAAPSNADDLKPLPAQWEEPDIALSVAAPKPVVAKRRPKALADLKAPMPAPAEIAEDSAAPKPVAVERLPIEPPRLREDKLLADLKQTAKVVGLSNTQSQTLLTQFQAVERAKIAQRARGMQEPLEEPETPDTGTRPEARVLALLPASDVETLPFAQKQNCQLDEPDARALEDYAEQLHKRINLTDQSIRRRFPSTAESRRDPAVVAVIQHTRNWQTPEAIPALMQILQVESPPVRSQLVEIMADLHTEESTMALVNRAVFDLSEDVRQQASEALRDRTRREYRQELLAALRYPWAPAAWHAAEALVQVKDTEAVPELIRLLDAPDPSQPYLDGTTATTMVREVVALNHAQNCLLCHARSQDPKKDFVRGSVPRPNSVAYYNDQSSPVFVRADTTYLRQDFSAMHVADGLGPSRTQTFERFDYLVRTREATPEEDLALKSLPAWSVGQYEQRDAVLYALQKLTGKNPGAEAEDWRHALSKRSSPQQILVESW